MTEKIKCKLTYNHFNKDCSEEIFLDEEDYELEAKQLLINFNDEEYERKKSVPTYPTDIRKFISVEKMSEKINYCNLEKRNIITKQDKNGYYDFLECKRCLRIYKRYTLHTPIQLICNPNLICKNCRKEFKTEKGIEKHKKLDKCKKHSLR